MRGRLVRLAQIENRLRERIGQRVGRAGAAALDGVDRHQVGGVLHRHEQHIGRRVAGLDRGGVGDGAVDEVLIDAGADGGNRRVVILAVGARRIQRRINVGAQDLPIVGLVIELVVLDAAVRRVAERARQVRHPVGHIRRVQHLGAFVDERRFAGADLATALRHLLAAGVAAVVGGAGGDVIAEPAGDGDGHQRVERLALVVVHELIGAATEGGVGRRRIEQPFVVGAVVIVAGVEDVVLPIVGAGGVAAPAIEAGQRHRGVGVEGHAVDARRDRRQLRRGVDDDGAGVAGRRAGARRGAHLRRDAGAARAAAAVAAAAFAAAARLTTRRRQRDVAEIRMRRGEIAGRAIEVATGREILVRVAAVGRWLMLGIGRSTTTDDEDDRERRQQ